MTEKDQGRNTSITKAEIDAFFEEMIIKDEKNINFHALENLLEENGISKDDHRISSLKESLSESIDEELDRSRFEQLLQENEVILKCFRKELVIPNFPEFSKDVEDIFRSTKSNTNGDIDESLPQHDDAENPPYAISVCTVDGQLLQLGDHDLAFSVQSISKVVNYAIAREELGRKKLHEHVGVEPGGEGFDAGMVLNEKDLPHNPLINSGAMMTASLIKQDLEMEQRLQYVIDVWEKMTGDKKVEYRKEAFETERKNADKNFALAHLMKDRGAFAENVDLGTVVDFYLKCCAIEVNIDDLAHAGATLANYGKCPSTGKKVFHHNTVRDTLSLMLSSGTYDHSGEFAFRVGLPAKSGISGGILVVVPGVLGIAAYSPPLDEHGNSVRGLEFCEKLVDRFNFHNFDSKSTSIHGKKDPRQTPHMKKLVHHGNYRQIEYYY